MITEKTLRLEDTVLFSLRKGIDTIEDRGDEIDTDEMREIAWWITEAIIRDFPEEFV